MYNILISFGVSTVVFVVIGLWMSPYAAVIPALILFAVLVVVLTRRLGKQVEKEMSKLVPLLQQRKIVQAERLIRRIQKDYGRWQVMLTGQLDAQLGMIHYLQLKWDKSLPLLKKGKWRNWAAMVCIGCVHYRGKRYEEAWKALEAAASVGRKEPMVYIVWATLLTRAGKRTEALDVLTRAQKKIPDSAVLKSLRSTIANKKKIQTKKFPETWYQFFPEDMAASQMMRGRKGGPPPGMGLPQPKVRGKAGRRR
jgi:tetratricopeptide (TPR) repeat protein